MSTKLYVVLDVGPERCKRLRDRVVDHLSRLETEGSVVRPSAASFDAASPYHPPAEHGSLWVQLHGAHSAAAGEGVGASAAAPIDAATAAAAATATWKPLVGAVASDWPLVRYINSCYPVKKQKAIFSAGGNEKELLDAIAKELADTPGVAALRLQVKHKPGDQGLLQRIGTALHAGGVVFHPKRYSHMLSVVHVCGDGFSDSVGGELLYGICAKEVIEPFLAASRTDQEDTSAFKVKEGLSKVDHSAVAAAAAAAGAGAAAAAAVIALDLGAAPGGWTAQLAGLGYSVIAIDPAKLDAGIAALEPVRHLAMRVNEALTLMIQEGVKANLCTCDMNFDAREAARAVASVSPCLLEGADLVMTIKLPEKCGANQVEKQVDESTAILKESGFGSFQVVHQMTNTPWERTVIAKYLPKADTAATGKQ